MKNGIKHVYLREVDIGFGEVNVLWLDHNLFNNGYYGVEANKLLYAKMKTFG